MINLDKPTSSISNTTRPSQGVTWSTWETPWEDEERTWRGLSQLFTNVSISFELWSFRTTPWLLVSPWLTTTNPFINVAKP